MSNNLCSSEYLVKLYAPVKQGPKFFWNIPWNIPRNIPWNIPRNMKFHEMEYSRKIAQHDNVEFFWNMEYSWNIPEKYYNKQNFPFFGIWNILEYSKEKLSQPKVPL